MTTMLDLNQLRDEFAKHLTTNAYNRFSMDAALMHVCSVAYDHGYRDGTDSKSSPELTFTNTLAYSQTKGESS